MPPRRFGAETVWRRSFGAETFCIRDVLALKCFGFNTTLSQSRVDSSTAFLKFRGLNTSFSEYRTNLLNINIDMKEFRRRPLGAHCFNL